MKFRIFGIEFECSFVFAAVLALFIAADRTGNILPLLLSVLLHETGHLAVMYVLGDPPCEIRLVPGSVRIVSKHIRSDAGEMLVLAAGPFINLLCFLILHLTADTELLNRFAAINLLLFFYNMIPVEGLDGGSLLLKVFTRFFGCKRAGYMISALTVLTGFLFVCFFLYLYRRSIVNYSVLIFAVYLILPVLIKNLC